jgi:putative ABC transport system permease protein
MRAVWTKILADLRQRRVQTAVVAVLVLLASSASTVGLTLMQRAGDPYDEAFAAQRGAHLRVTFDATIASAQQVAGTSRLLNAAASAGPWPVAETVRFQTAGGSQYLDVTGRTDPGGPVEQLRITSGRFASAAGEIVVTRSFADLKGIAVGDQIRAVNAPGKPMFHVVGEVIDVDEGSATSYSQSAWVIPEQVSALQQKPFVVMGFRFTPAPTASQIGALTDRLQAALPKSAIDNTTDYLYVKSNFDLISSFIITFLVAFSVFTLAAAAVIITNVVTAIVVASYREVGIMKAVGFTPGQVVQVISGLMLVPAVIGCAIGIPLGVGIAGPLLERGARALGFAAPPALSPSAMAIVFIGIIVVVTLAAGVPALRAGRLETARAIAIGTAPERSRRSRLARLLARLGFSRTLTLGVAQAFVRPVRGTLALMTILAGVATITFAVGLNGSFRLFVNGQPTRFYQVQLTPVGTGVDPRVMAAINSQPETARVVARSLTNVTIPQLSDPVNAYAFRGNSSALGFQISEGRWFAGPGEAVTAKGLLRDAHLKLGDSVTGMVQGHPMSFRIVGVVFDPINYGHVLRLDWSTYTQAVPAAEPDSYLVQLTPGADPAAYVQRVEAAETQALSAEVTVPKTLAPESLVNEVGTVLGVLLGVIGIAAVFNSVLLNAHERVRDTAILKALGMTPRQVMAMVTASAAVLGLIAGVIGVPAGVLLHRLVIQAVGQVIGNDMPPEAFDVFNPFLLPWLGMAGLLVAMIGGALPAYWAGRLPTVAALQTE